MGKLKPNEISHKCPMLYLIPATTNLLNFLARWEFCPFLPQKVYRVNPFWFQQDNSTAYANRAINPFRRFNSQRIELFHIPAGRYKMQWQKFQFPTWWNSIHALSANAKVEEGFNSQRDGILHARAQRGSTSQRVSIPNGMEFYPDVKILLNR